MKVPNRTKTRRLRVTPAQDALIDENARRAGLKDASKYLRLLALSEEGVELARALGGREALNDVAIGTAGCQEGESRISDVSEAPPRRPGLAEAAARARQARASLAA